MTIIDAVTVKALIYACSFISFLAVIVGNAVFHWLIAPFVEKRKTK